MCGMLLGSRASHCEPYTGRPDSACMVTGVMNCSAAAGHHHLHGGALLDERRHSSAAL
jgi:hypothetical protein